MAKNGNGTIWKILAIVVTLILAAASGLFGYGRLNGRFEAVENQIPKIDANENAIIGMQKDIGYIKKAVDEIRDDLKQKP